MRLARLLPLCLLLAACASAPPPGCSRLGRDGALCLLPPAALPPLDAVHMVTLTRDGHEESFLGQLHIDDRALRLAASSLFGTGLFQISYDGQTVNSEPQRPELHAEMLVVTLELALADPAALRPRLHNLELQVHGTPQGETRELLGNGRLLVRIERGPGPVAAAPVRIEIPPLQLDVDMKSLPDGTP